MVAVKKHSLNEDPCPISESALGDLRESNPVEAIAVASELPEAQRARLAAFCYERQHLHHLGLMIASTCGLFHLKRVFGNGGEVIFRQSRDPHKTIAEQRRNSNQHFSKPVTLASLAPHEVETED